MVSAAVWHDWDQDTPRSPSASWLPLRQNPVPIVSLPRGRRGVCPPVRSDAGDSGRGFWRGRPGLWLRALSPVLNTSEVQSSRCSGRLKADPRASEAKGTGPRGAAARCALLRPDTGTAFPLTSFVLLPLLTQQRPGPGQGGRRLSGEDVLLCV